MTNTNTNTNTRKKKILEYSNIFLDSYYHYVITALSLVVGLTWKDTLMTSFKNNKFLNKFGPWGYTIVLTIIVIILIQIINLVLHKENDEMTM
tara:strand:+ start:1504 stop:1782 length:279 start_codon:yes stop_codon:yes gene_type:complete